ncbi:CDP-glucose 4,6-dehydratase [Alphaproteobacteria bacterium]|nr:CDP-glucose 4,6-dehydratase [Alphaproteobacteria bacterium]
MVNLNYLTKCFSGKKVFVTGNTGFKGSWLALVLHEIGADVMGFSLPPTGKSNHFNLLGLEKKITHVSGDIRDISLLKNTLGEFQPQFVFHLAAQALVRPSYDDPVTTFSTNVLGSVNLLEAVRKCNSVRSLVYVTSDKCYENVEWVYGYRENDQLGGRDPYSASKAAAEVVFSSYLRSFFEHKPSLGAASARAGNVIGGGDWSVDRIIPDCIRAIQSDTPILLRNPGATRPWQHVLEPIAGYMLLASKLYDEPKQWNGSWNFGPSTREILTVQEVAELMIGYLGQGSIEIEQASEQAHEANLLQLNCDKAQQLLGWQPKWDARQTIEATAFWYKDMMGGISVGDISRKQILSFFKEDA